MSNADQSSSAEGQQGEDEQEPGALDSAANRYSFVIDQFVRGVELAAATVFAALFAVGLADLTFQIFEAVQSGAITDPLVVIGFIDTGLLLLIIVEVYQTVVAYARSDETARILRLVIFTGVIALVRKVIVYRTGEFETKQEALLVAGSYGLLTLTLAVLLYVSYQYVGSPGDPARY